MFVKCDGFCSSRPWQRSWLLQPKFKQSSAGETYLLPSAPGRPRGAETAAGRSADGRPSSSTGKGADD